MRFNFLILINLAAIFSLGSSILNFKQYLRDPLPDNCSRFVLEKIKIFENCNVSEKKSSIDFGTDAEPYMCLLTLDVATEFCKVPDRIKHLEGVNSTKSVCPIDYSLKSSNLRTNITKGVQYMSYEKNCTTVCRYSQIIFSVCQFIAFANKVIKEDRVGENLDLMKENEKQSQDLPKIDKTISLTLPGKISQDSKLASQIISVMPGQTIGNKVQYVTDEEFSNTKPVAKTNVESLNKKSSNEHFDLKTDVENRKTNDFLKSNSNFKIVNDKHGVSKTVNEPVLKKDNDNHNEEQNENNKSQVFLTSENAGLPETESSSLPENLYSSKNNQYNDDVNKNNNNKNNNNNNDFLDDSVPKTPHDEAEDDDENNDEELEKSGLQDAQPDREPQFAKTLNSKETYSSDNFFQAEDSHFSVYFLSTISIIIIGYVIYHNKKKIVAYALEGRRNRNGRRRPTSASYRKLDCNLEEAIASNPSNTSVTNVVY